MPFKRAIFRIESDDARNTTVLELKRDGEASWTPCLVFPKAIDFPVHAYISAGGQIKKRRAVFIHSLKFYDNEAEIVGEAEAKAGINTESYRNFRGTATDLLHLGNIDGVLLKDE